MKYLIAFLVFLSFQTSYSKDTNLSESNELEFIQSSYASTAYTENPYGQNYSLNIVIYGNSTSYSNNISYVTVNGSRVSHTPVYGQSGKYRISYNSNTYYFTF
jgi:hypothetical protein